MEIRGTLISMSSLKKKILYNFIHVISWKIFMYFNALKFLHFVMCICCNFDSGLPAIPKISWCCSYDWSVLLASKCGSGQVPDKTDLAPGEAGGLRNPAVPKHHLLPQVHLGGLPWGHGDTQQQ